MRITETDLRRVFQASLWLKGGHSLAEVLGGLALTFLNHDLIVRIATVSRALQFDETSPCA